MDGFLRRADHAYRLRASEESAPGETAESETEGHALRWRGVPEDTQDKVEEPEIEGHIVNIRRSIIRE